MLQTYQSLENRIDYVKRRFQYATHESVSDYTYKEALKMLGSTENDELLTIENRLFEKLHYINEALHSARKAKDEVVGAMRKAELDAVYQAYKDIRSRKHYLMQNVPEQMHLH